MPLLRRRRGVFCLLAFFAGTLGGCTNLEGSSDPGLEPSESNNRSGGSAGTIAHGSAGALVGVGSGGGAAGSSAGAGGKGGSSGSPSHSTVGPDKAPRSNASWVYVSGYQLMVGRRQKDGEVPSPTPYAIKGVSWSPIPVGQRNTSGYTQYYTQYADQDSSLLEGMSANTVRTYNAFETTPKGLAILDELYAKGIMVIMTVLPSYWDSQSGAYLRAVDYFKGHPAILMWGIGNELNYNHLYNSSITLDQAVQIVKTAIDEIHNADGEHPVTVSWGNAPAGNFVAALGNTDVWSLNLYPYLDLSSRFDQWAASSKQPIIVGEYGADAYNAKLNREDQDAQAEATTKLTMQIQAYYSAKNPNRPVVGGCIFELADEWWKAGEPGTSPSSHDVGGFANSGVYPDGVANEEWWGVVTVDRQPRKAYDALKALYAAP
jgi:hypothetical protein